jgi:hypothetical protein
MTIQRIAIDFRNITFEVILEDGMVSFVDPADPLIRKSIGQPSGVKITTIEGAKRMALQMIERSLSVRVLQEHL